ncbi:MAG: hypothetical protein ABIN58_09715 [candidate division WOR-3 bacterium]
MSQKKEKLIVTLLVEEGTKGDPVGSYGDGRRSRGSIVFLPAAAKSHLGKNVRVELQEIRPDSRGVMMYRGVPAPDIYAERWRDNGDGTLSRLTVATDWLGQEVELGVVETRPSGAREGIPSTQSNLQVVWGQDLASSVVEDRQIRLIPLEEERVEDGRLVWRKVGERSENLPVKAVQVLGVKVAQDCEWYRNRLQTTYDPNCQVQLYVRYGEHKATGSWESTLYPTARWAEMPGWWRAEQEAHYPVCSCGRQRRDTQIADGFGKCELCRAEGICERCGKQIKVTVVDSHLVCDACRPYAEQERLIARLLNTDHLAAIAEEARGLLALQPLKKEEGEAVLKATVDSSVFRREGYGWYYFGQLGEVYGTKLAPAALKILENLPSATGNGIMELISWVVGGPRPANPAADYYLQTQVEDKQAMPDLTETCLKQVVEKIAGSQPVLADLLRGPKVDLDKILSDLRRNWLVMPGKGDPEGGSEMAPHRLEKYGKEFIRLQLGREYASLGNSARRHSVLAKCQKAISGNWKALQGLRPLTSQAIAWLKEHSFIAPVGGWDALKEAFRGVPSSEEIKGDLRKQVSLPEIQLDEIASRERSELLRRREGDFWTFLGSHPSNPPEPNRGKDSYPADTVMAQAMRKAGLL